MTDAIIPWLALLAERVNGPETTYVYRVKDIRIFVSEGGDSPYKYKVYRGSGLSRNSAVSDRRLFVTNIEADLKEWLMYHLKVDL